MNEKRRLLPIAGLLLLCASRGVAADSRDLSHAWFEPSLTTNNEPICAEVLAIAKTKFASEAAWLDYGSDILGIWEREPAEGLQFVKESDLEREGRNIILPSAGTQLHARTYVNSGCGGACETYSLAAADHVLPDVQPQFSPISASWSWYRAGERYYAAGIVDRQLQVYRIGKTLTLSCEVRVEPTELRESSDAATQKAVRSLDALERVVGGLTRGSGSCGSSDTLSRWEDRFHDSLTQTLFRPWAVGLHERWPRKSDNSFGDYDRNLEHLKSWSLTGLSEQRAFAEYNTQLAASIAPLAEFYERNYRWSAEESRKMAQEALEDAIGIQFGFYMYEPFAQPTQRELMQAVLEHRPMSEIKAIPLSFGKPESFDDEAVLSAAVTYPEALRYLLDNGANPNKTNAFGKTPLMYAAQYDNQAAAEILLDHHADPNATTTIPFDTCYYALETSNMTPLHYAVRYASVPLVRLLVQRGAVGFIRTRKYRDPDAYAIDWLQRYRADDDASELAVLLRVPDQDERSRISTKLTELGEAEYAAGRPQAAFQALRTALHAQRNQKALEDLPLIALQAGNFGPSLEAADELISANISSASAARAWFNKGLACERWRKTGVATAYNGNYYCRHSRVHPFLMSWKLQPTAARKNKLAEIFKDGRMPTCSFDDGRSQIHLAYADEAGDGRYQQMIYVYESVGRPIDPESLRWDSETPAPVASYDLGGARLSVLTAQGQVNWPSGCDDRVAPSPESTH